MKQSTKDQVEGKYRQMTGRAKEIAGKISDNPKLEVKGAGEKIIGKAQEKIGQVNRVFGK